MGILNKFMVTAAAATTVIGLSGAVQAEELTDYGPNSVPSNVVSGQDFANHFIGNTEGYLRYLADDNGNVSVYDGFCDGSGNLSERTGGPEGRPWMSAEDAGVLVLGKVCIAAGLPSGVDLIFQIEATGKAEFIEETTAAAEVKFAPLPQGMTNTLGN